MLPIDTVCDFGQLFIMAFDGLTVPLEVAEFFKRFRIGGVILFSDNFESSRQLRELTKELQQKCAIGDRPLFIATDHEGGRVQRFRQDFTLIPSMASLSDCRSEEIENLYKLVAEELRDAGVNFNFAPVADICEPGAEQGIGDRSFGIEPEKVARRVAAVVKGLQSKGVLSCVKHFPGHGCTLQDSHRELPISDSTYEQLFNKDLVPFREAISVDVAAVMTAHVTYPMAGDKVFPATLSPFWLQNILRQQMGFRGLIITDAIEMKGLLTRWTPAESGLLALEAGADILIYYKEAHQFKAFYELRSALERGDLDRRKIRQKILRVMKVKQKLFAGKG